MVKITLGELARILGGTVVGDESVTLHTVAGIREAGPGDLTFLATERYEPFLAETRASAVILDTARSGLSINQLVHKNPYLAYLKAVEIFRPDRYPAEPGVHPTASVHPSATIGEGVSIGPAVTVSADAQIGDGVVLMSGCYVGPNAKVGKDSRLFPNVVIRNDCELGERVTLHPGVVIGADGYGYVSERTRYHKVPQVGNVVIGDDVEIGANSCVDRATTGTTRVGRGTKIDNLVQIGHNVQIGEDVAIVAQVGVSGSTVIERHAMLAGQAGLAGHLTIGENAVVGAQAGVTRSVPPNTQVSGYPARPHSEQMRIQAMSNRLPELAERLRELEEKVQQLEEEKKAADLRTGG